jgi:N-acyl-phosphatidylethanolamine-hydrolysing phospholipase D
MIRLIWAGLTLGIVLLVSSASGDVSPVVPALLPAKTVVAGLTHALWTGRVFKNTDPAYHRASLGARAAALIVDGSWRRPDRVAPLPVAVPDLSVARDSGAATVTWIGHSTLLVQLDGATFLTDPNWAKRAGPVSRLLGVGRYTPVPIRLDALPPIDFVLISHDHYDHLDEPTVRRLAERFDPLFVVPLGIKAWLAERGITNAVELDWGESVTVKGLRVVCAPAQHGSGRTLADRGRRLWASWAVLGSKRFYFAGDSGYYRHFHEIGEVLGPFDLAALPIGSYAPQDMMRPVHMSPEEALQAWLDLRATRFIGIHWGTFGLAREPHDEPPKRIAAEVARRQIDPDAIWIRNPGDTARW